MAEQLRRGDKDAVREGSDIVRVVGEHVALKAKGREYVGLCPFHDDHNPSMSVVPHKQIYHCFVCGAGGDVFSFVQRYHSMEFREALEFLAARAGIELERASPEQRESGGVSSGALVEANKAASEFFATILRHPEHGRAARELIERRGISEEMVSAFGIGAAPAMWDGLVQAIAGKGLDQRAFAEAGLLKDRESGGRYDLMRGRLVFPIRDQIGRVIAFGGRRIDDGEEPKYLNSPETRVFHKSKSLYGLDRASRAIQRERAAVVVEGYLDVIACHQAGFTNAVATLGTALTPEHAAVLRRLCETVVLVFDSDEAGGRAAERATEVFFAEPIDVKIATLKGAKDPDELLKSQGGSERFAAALGAAADLLSYRFGRVRARLAGAGPSALAKAVEEELAELARLGLNEQPPLRRRLVLRSIASITGLDERTIARATPAGRRSARKEEPAAGERSTPEAELLGCVLVSPELYAGLHDRERDLLGEERYASRPMQRIARLVHEIASTSGRPDLAGVLAASDEIDVQEAAVALARRVEHETDRDEERLHAHWEQCLIEVRRRGSAGEIEHKTDAASRLARVRRAREELGPDWRAYPRRGGAS